MKAPTPDALGFGLLLSRACARLTLSMEDRLGDFHGLDFEDFRLLHRLADAPDGRLAMEDLAHMLCMKRSCLARKRLVQEAEATARAVCVQALERVRVAHVPETVLALAALCQDEALADARS